MKKLAPSINNLFIEGEISPKRKNDLRPAEPKTLPINEVIAGDCLGVMRGFPAGSVNLVMFSPPYWGLRDYGENVNSVWGGDPSCEHEWIEVVKPASSGAPGHETLEGGLATQHSAATRQNHVSNTCVKCGAWRGQLGLEPTYQMYVQHLIEVGREVRRILRGDGSWYLNLGDTYSATRWSSTPSTTGKSQPCSDIVHVKDVGKIPDKCKLLIPYRVALALIDNGWTVRNDITWYKPNAMPSSVKDRLTCQTERVFHLVKSRKYYYDLDAIREPHKNIEEIEYRRELRKDKKYDVKVPSYQPAVNPGNPLGKNPGDVVGFTKHDKAVGRLEHFSYPDPLHAKEYHPAGKNPGDVVETEQKYRQSTSFPHERWFDQLESKHSEAAYHPLGRNPGDFWPITTKPFPEAHFAVYPEALCERPIKSSCPAEVCRRCGRPRERITRRTNVRKQRPSWRGEGNAYGIVGGNLKGRTGNWGADFETVGWTDCNCGAGFEGGIVLDPMCGAGTTLAVAKKLGRRYIGVDLNPDYCEMARRRLGQVESPLEVYA